MSMLKSRQATVRRRRALQQRSALYFPTPQTESRRDSDYNAPAGMFDLQDVLYDAEAPVSFTSLDDSDDLATAV